jgi:cell division protein FtsI/penicillin-binding protein 2
MLARTDSRARALVLLILISLLATGIGLRLVWWHVIEQGRFAAMALHQLAQVQEIPAERGEIRDRNGTLLATSIELQSVFATPPQVTDRERAASLLASVLKVPKDEIRAKLNGGAQWVWLARRVAPEVATRIAALDLAGVGMVPETQRVYPVEGAAPGTTIAAQLLGFVNDEANTHPDDGAQPELAGQYGVERAEDALLAGQPGQVTAQEDVAGRRIADSVYSLTDPVDGADLTLTIDAGVQHLLESVMYESFTKNAADGVTGIVMNVRDGSILGMASYPSFDANAYGAAEPDRFVSPAASRQYEPGSVMKAFTVAAALDAGAISVKDTVYDDNNLQVGGVRIQNADRYWFPGGHGPLTAGDVLALSNNVGAAKIGLTLGGERLFEAFRRFGFGAPTGIDIAGEASGLVWDPADPNASGDLTTAQNSFGQGISVTALQLIAGYAAIGNGGTLVTPHVVSAWTGPDGELTTANVEPGERIMRQETADTVLHLLTNGIDNGIANAASIPGYAIAGKTGTAQIAGPVKVEVPDGTNPDGTPKTKIVEQMQYIDGWIDSSFIGLAPATDPQIVVYILLHKPATWGLYQMADRPENVFSRLAPQLFDYLAIPPDRPEQPVAMP